MRWRRDVDEGEGDNEIWVEGVGGRSLRRSRGSRKGRVGEAENLCVWRMQ